eukprot:gb/GECH01005978.1/.p1 GENE.gb/GECH01005978.1/~~gb/GECH01005978.1/.p1  ORF type:complete len:4701 (+),score=834.10 gb/GECH01005978.1/:1-14103(+)
MYQNTQISLLTLDTTISSFVQENQPACLDNERFHILENLFLSYDRFNRIYRNQAFEEQVLETLQKIETNAEVYAKWDYLSMLFIGYKMESYLYIVKKNHEEGRFQKAWNWVSSFVTEQGKTDPIKVARQMLNTILRCAWQQLEQDESLVEIVAGTCRVFKDAWEKYIFIHLENYLKVSGSFPRAISLLALGREDNFWPTVLKNESSSFIDSPFFPKIVSHFGITNATLKHILSKASISNNNLYEVVNKLCELNLNLEKRIKDISFYPDYDKSTKTVVLCALEPYHDISLELEAIDPSFNFTCTKILETSRDLNPQVFWKMQNHIIKGILHKKGNSFHLKYIIERYLNSGHFSIEILEQYYKKFSFSFDFKLIEEVSQATLKLSEEQLFDIDSLELSFFLQLFKREDRMTAKLGLIPNFGKLRSLDYFRERMHILRVQETSLPRNLENLVKRAAGNNLLLAYLEIMISHFAKHPTTELAVFINNITVLEKKSVDSEICDILMAAAVKGVHERNKLVPKLDFFTEMVRKKKLKLTKNALAGIYEAEKCELTQAMAYPSFEDLKKITDKLEYAKLGSFLGEKDSYLWNQARVFSKAKREEYLKAIGIYEKMVDMCKFLKNYDVDVEEIQRKADETLDVELDRNINATIEHINQIKEEWNCHLDEEATQLIKDVSESKSVLLRSLWNSEFQGQTEKASLDELQEFCKQLIQNLNSLLKDDEAELTKINHCIKIIIDENIVVDEEVQNLFKLNCVSGISGEQQKIRINMIQDVLEFVVLARKATKVTECFRQYEMTQCFQDEKLNQLNNILEEFNNQQEYMVFHQVQNMRNQARKTLNFDSSVIALCDIVRECGAVVDFIRKNGFVGTKGRDQFQRKLDMVTHQLQGVEYDSRLLGDLNTAFRLVAPFGHTEVTLDDFLEETSQVRVSKGALEAIKRVHKNMDQIRIWFSSLGTENIVETVKKLFETGRLESILTDKQKFIQARYKINGENKVHIMEGDDLESFINKVIFVSSENQDKEVLNLLENFISIFRMFKEFHLIHIELSGSRVPGSSQDVIIWDLDEPFEAHQEEFEGMQKDLEEWKEKISQLKDEYPLLNLFENIGSWTIMSDAIEKEDCQTLIKYLRVFIRDYPLEGIIENWLENNEEDDESFGVSVGKLLHHCADQYGLSVTPNEGKEYYIRHNHSSTSKLGILLLELEEGFPELNHVMWCSQDTTSQEVEDFIDRIKNVDGKYYFMQVNELPSLLRNKLLSIHTRFEASEHNMPDVYYIFTSDTGIAPFQERISLLSQDNLSDYEIYESIKNYVPFEKFQLVTGRAGDGKTHYIKKQIKSDEENGFEACRFVINEEFNLTKAVKEMNKFSDKTQISLHIDLYCTAPEDSLTSFILQFYSGTVYDPSSGQVFSLPQDNQWRVYLEHPSFDEYKGYTPDFSLLKTLNWGDQNHHLVSQDTPWEIDEDTRRVCRYLDIFYKNKERYCQDEPISYEDINPSDEECTQLLQRVLNSLEHVKGLKLRAKFLIQFLLRRVKFIEQSSFFMYNEEPNLLRETIRLMLEEVNELCSKNTRMNWNKSDHIMLLYNGECLTPACRSDRIQTRINPPLNKQLLTGEKLSCEETRNHLLADVLETNSSSIKSIIDSTGYVMTSDFAFKMIYVHECKMSGKPIIIEGETGVGKTELLSLYSKFLQTTPFDSSKDTYLFFKETLVPLISNQNSRERVEQYISKNGPRSTQELIETFDVILNNATDQDNVAICQKTIEFTMEEYQNEPLLERPEIIEKILNDPSTAEPTIENCTKLLRKMLDGEHVGFFKRIMVHASLTPSDLKQELEKYFTLIRKCSNDRKFVVFLDEVNTSSCLGVFKEIIVDHRLNGEPLPPNVFFIGAINPLRDEDEETKSAVQEASGKIAFRDKYEVNPLPAPLHEFVVDFGSMDDLQQKSYVDILSRRFNKTEKKIFEQDLSMERILQVVTDCHNFVSKAFGQSAVSQRDILRTFKLIKFFIQQFQQNKLSNLEEPGHTCLVLSTALSYYLRLNANQRQDFEHRFDQHFINRKHDFSFEKILRRELKSFVDHFELPKGVAKTQSLQENLFSMVISILTRIPLILIGPPGNAKTLSFKIATENLRGSSSPSPFFRDFPAVDVFSYQCSEYSTSSEIKYIFDKAIDRQEGYRKKEEDNLCVVFLDEAGLPDERKAPLKILHYFLDATEVAFIAITNSPLDSAKSNRALNVMRPMPQREELLVLAQGCLQTNQEDILENLCDAYTQCREDVPYFANRFHLRDLIHFFKFLRRKSSHADFTPALIMYALERNFNRSDQYFDDIATIFFGKIGFSEPKKRYTLQVVRSSLADVYTEGDFNQNSVRYKLIIDPTNDNSAIRMLMNEDCLKSRQIKIFNLADFPGSSKHLEKSRVISQIKQSMKNGDTILMFDTDPIHTSFYDVFNQYFTTIHDDDGNPEYFANVAIGSYSRPCPVSPKFQCIIHLPLSRLENTPVAFLNRFEKFIVHPQDVLEYYIEQLPDQLQRRMYNIWDRCQEFVDHFGEMSFLGYSPHTLTSCVLSYIKDGKLTEHTREREAIEDICGSLLGVLKPEALMLKRKTIPKKFSQMYIEQEHFDLRNFIEKSVNHMQETESRTKKIMLTTRSPIDVLALQNESELIQRYIFEEPQAVRLINLEELASAAEFQSCLDEFIFKLYEKRICFMIADTANVSLSRIRAFRHFIEEAERNINDQAIEVQKMFVVAIVTTKEWIHPTCDVMFLNNWKYHYIDTCDGNKHISSINATEWLIKSFNLSNDQHLTINNCFMSFLEDQIVLPLSHIRTSTINIRLKLHNGATFYNYNVKQKVECFHHLQSFPAWRNLLENSIIPRFAAKFSSSKCLGILEQASKKVLIGESLQSLTTSIERKFRQLMTGYLSFVLSKLADDFGMLPLFRAIENQEEMHLKFIQTILEHMYIPDIEEIEEKLSQEHFLRNSLRIERPHLTMSYYINDRIELLRRTVLESINENERTPETLTNRLTRVMKEDPVISECCPLLEENSNLFESYMFDVIFFHYRITKASFNQIEVIRNYMPSEIEDPCHVIASIYANLWLKTWEIRVEMKNIEEKDKEPTVYERTTQLASSSHSSPVDRLQSIIQLCREHSVDGSKSFISKLSQQICTKLIPQLLNQVNSIDEVKEFAESILNWIYDIEVPNELYIHSGIRKFLLHQILKHYQENRKRRNKDKNILSTSLGTLLNRYIQVDENNIPCLLNLEIDDVFTNDIFQVIVEYFMDLCHTYKNKIDTVSVIKEFSKLKSSEHKKKTNLKTINNRVLDLLIIKLFAEDLESILEANDREIIDNINDILNQQESAQRLFFTIQESQLGTEVIRKRFSSTSSIAYKACRPWIQKWFKKQEQKDDMDCQEKIISNRTFSSLYRFYFMTQGQEGNQRYNQLSTAIQNAFDSSPPSFELIEDWIKEISQNNAADQLRARTMLLMALYENVFYSDFKMESKEHMINWLSNSHWIQTHLDLNEKEVSLLTFWINPNSQKGIQSIAQEMLDPKKQEQHEIRDLMACLSATMIGMPRNTFNLQQHLFDTATLGNTYMMGNQQSAPVAGYHYDCGCDLDEYGNIPQGRPHRNPLTVQELYPVYVLCWGTLILSILSQPHGENGVSSKIVAPYTVNAVYGNSQREKLENFVWQRVLTSFSFMDSPTVPFLNETKRPLYFIDIMERMLFIGWNEKPADCVKPIYNSLPELQEYEQWFKDSILEPSRNNIENRLLDYEESQKGMDTNAIIEISKEIRDNPVIDELCIPSKYSRTETYWKHLISSLNNLGNNYDDEELAATSKLLHNSQALQFMNLLPQLARFYLWIHQTFSCLFTKEEINRISVSKLINLYCSKVDAAKGKEIRDLFKEMKKLWEKCSSQLQVFHGVVACEGEKIQVIDDENWVLRFLVSTDDEDGHENNYLFRLMSGLSKIQNDTLPPNLDPSPEEVHLLSFTLSSVSDKCLIQLPDMESFQAQIMALLDGNSSPSTEDWKIIHNFLKETYINGKASIKAEQHTMNFETRQHQKQKTTIWPSEIDEKLDKNAKRTIIARAGDMPHEDLLQCQNFLYELREIVSNQIEELDQESTFLDCAGYYGMNIQSLSQKTRSVIEGVHTRFLQAVLQILQTKTEVKDYLYSPDEFPHSLRIELNPNIGKQIKKEINNMVSATNIPTTIQTIVSLMKSLINNRNELLGKENQSIHEIISVDSKFESVLAKVKGKHLLAVLSILNKKLVHLQTKDTNYKQLFDDLEELSDSNEEKDANTDLEPEKWWEQYGHSEDYDEPLEDYSDEEKANNSEIENERMLFSDNSEHDRFENENKNTFEDETIGDQEKAEELARQHYEQFQQKDVSTQCEENDFVQPKTESITSNNEESDLDQTQQQYQPELDREYYENEFYNQAEQQQPEHQELDKKYYEDIIQKRDEKILNLERQISDMSTSISQMQSMMQYMYMQMPYTAIPIPDMHHSNSFKPRPQAESPPMTMNPREQYSTMPSEYSSSWFHQPPSRNWQEQGYETNSQPENFNLSEEYPSYTSYYGTQYYNNSQSYSAEFNHQQEQRLHNHNHFGDSNSYNFNTSGVPGSQYGASFSSTDPRYYYASNTQQQNPNNTNIPVNQVPQDPYSMKHSAPSNASHYEDAYTRFQVYEQTYNMPSRNNEQLGSSIHSDPSQSYSSSELPNYGFSEANRTEQHETQQFGKSNNQSDNYFNF